MALSKDNDTGHLGSPLDSPGGSGSYSGPGAGQQSTKPSLYSGLPKTSTQVQPAKDADGAHLGTPVKPIKQPVPNSNDSAGMPYSDYDY